MKSVRRGFTLIELLISVAVIGILSTVGIVSYDSARQSARDVKRVSDVKQIQSALELYFENHGSYPGDGRVGEEGKILGQEDSRTFSDNGFSNSVSGMVYMLTVPRNTIPNGSHYVYRSLFRSGTDCNHNQCEEYAILFTLEKAQGGYASGAHALTSVGLAGKEEGLAQSGIVGAGGEIIGIRGVQAELAQYAEELAQNTMRIIDDPAVENTALVLAPTATVASFLSAVFAVPQGGTYFWIFFTQPLLFIGRKKRKGWGMVYNTLSRLGEDLAIVRLRDAKNNRIVKSAVTDKDGRFSFLASPGSYRIDVLKDGFIFPSGITEGKKEDGDFSQVYHGEVILVNDEGALLTPNIPIDPFGAKEEDEAVIVKEKKRKRRSLYAGISPVLGGIAFIIMPSVLLGLFFIAQIIFYFLFKRLAENSIEKKWGIVYEENTKKPVPYAVLRIFETRFNKLLETQVADSVGRYQFRVGGNEYYVTVSKPGYAKTETNPIDLRNKKEPTIIDSPIPLRKL